jgi:hypothetical protein
MLKLAVVEADWQRWLPVKFPCFVKICSHTAKTKAGCYAHMRIKHGLSAEAAAQLQLVEEVVASPGAEPMLALSPPHSVACTLQGTTMHTGHLDSDCDSGIRSNCQSPLDLDVHQSSTLTGAVVAQPITMSPRNQHEMPNDNSDNIDNGLPPPNSMEESSSLCSTLEQDDGTDTPPLTDRSTQIAAIIPKQATPAPVPAQDTLAPVPASAPTQLRSSQSPPQAGCKRAKRPRINLQCLAATASWSMPAHFHQADAAEQLVLDMVDARLRDSLSLQHGSTVHQEDVLKRAERGISLVNRQHVEAFVLTLLTWLKVGTCQHSLLTPTHCHSSSLSRIRMTRYHSSPCSTCYPQPLFLAFPPS